MDRCRLGADTSGSRFGAGQVPQPYPNPEDKGAAQSIEEAVQGTCGLGIVFDTDMTGQGAMDSKCRLLNKTG